MDIVSDLPFKLQLIKKFPFYQVQNASAFCKEEEDVWNNNIITLSVEENEDIEILFDSLDSKAMLYMDELDIVPFNDSNLGQDESGQIYRLPDKEPFILYRSNAGYDALRIDVLRIAIFCYNEWYYGAFEVLPKPMSLSEWKIMRDDLENEIIGLAQDIVRKNIGLGTIKNGGMPPKYLYDFFVIRKYAKAVLAALSDITEKPRYTIQTRYEMVSNSQNGVFDKETIKRYVMRGGSEAIFKIPEKVIYYDIQDNRMLKKILIDYEKRLNNFLELIDVVEQYSNSFLSGDTVQYKNSWRKSIFEFRETALKLRKMTGMLTSQEWYQRISDITSPNTPHSFILDIRYNTLYQMYTELKKEKFKITLDPEFSYIWKRSSYLYEMWCFLKVCQLLSEDYNMEYEDWKIIFSDKVLFPFLQKGTCIRFNNDKVELHVIFDNPLPMSCSMTSLYKPIFMARSLDYTRTHNRPDILVNIYNKSCGWYIGSIILECKYRKLNSFLSNKSMRSSLDQLETYYNNARTEYLFGKFGKRMDIRPIRKVIVLTPDIQGDGVSKLDFNILVKGFKPFDTDFLQKSLLNEINYHIQEAINISWDLQNI